jgi:hypothetical protein
MTVNQANQDQTATAVQPPDTALPEGGQEALAAAASVNVTSDFAAMTLSDEANENSQNENVENDDEDHECTEECGFCEDEEGINSWFFLDRKLVLSGPMKSIVFIVVGSLLRADAT